MTRLPALLASLTLLVLSACVQTTLHDDEPPEDKEIIWECVWISNEQTLTKRWRDWHPSDVYAADALARGKCQSSSQNPATCHRKFCRWIPKPFQAPNPNVIDKPYNPAD